jgi:importin subunit beta-1
MLYLHISRTASLLFCRLHPGKPHEEDFVWIHILTAYRADTDNTLRTAAYEVLNAFVTNSAGDSLTVVAQLSEEILDRLEKTIPMQAQIVSVEDRLTLEEMQTSLTSVVIAIIQRLEVEIRPLADRIMQCCLQLLNVVGPKSSVPDTVFSAVGSLANALEGDFVAYMDAFSPYLYKGLENQEEPSLCSMAIGLVSDITRALNEKVQPYCDDFMNRLLQDLQSPSLGNQFKPAILQCFGDIAQAIGGHFEVYLRVVAQVLNQASAVSINQDTSFELLDYIISLREGIMDAWDGAIVAMKTGNKSKFRRPLRIDMPLTSKATLLGEFVESIFQFLHVIYADPNRTEALLRSSMGVIGLVKPSNFVTFYLLTLTGTSRRRFQTANMPTSSDRTGSCTW